MSDNLADALEKASQDRQRFRRQALKLLRESVFTDSGMITEEDDYEARKFKRGYAADLVDARIVALLRKYHN